MTQKVKILCFATLLISIAAVHPLLAQREPPPSSGAGVQDKKTFEGASAELVEGKRKKPEIEEGPREEMPSAQAETKFFVRAISIQGNELIQTRELTPFLTPYEGKELTLTKANELAKKIEQEYRRRGYLTTLVYVPPQKIETNEITLRVLEGKLGTLSIEGNKWFTQGTIRRYWRFKAGEPFRYENVARSLRRMNENPDREVRAVLKPGKETGLTDVYLKVKDRFPGHLGFQYDNEGVRSTGRQRFGFTGRYNNWMIPDSILLAGMVFGKNFGAVFTQYLIPISSFGTKLIGGFSHSQVAPKREFRDSDINGRSETYSLTIRQALFDRDRFSSHASLGFDFKDSRTKDVSGTRRRDRLRILRPSLDFSGYDRWGSTGFSNEFSFGIKGFGHTSVNNPFAGRAGADPDFIKYEGTLTRSLKLPFDAQANLKLASQLSLNKLTPQEEFYLGGARTVRGYPEGDFLGDNGFLFNFDYLVPFPLIPEDWKFPGSENQLRKEIQMVFFVDHALGRLRGAALTETRSRQLLGLGGGLRIQLAKHLAARVEVAHALGQEPLTESDHTRLHFSLQMEV